MSQWYLHFPCIPLDSDNLPFFDSRIVCYPTDTAVKDYLRWRQVDAHINNLYNTTFWLLVKDYQNKNVDWTVKQAREKAHADMNTVYASSSQKNELLHSYFKINYNDEPECFRKGSILVWQTDENFKSRYIEVKHCDIINESFYSSQCPGIIPYKSFTQLKKEKKAQDSLKVKD